MSVCIDSVSPTVLTMCCMRLDTCLNSLSHILHVYGHAGTPSSSESESRPPWNCSCARGFTNWREASLRDTKR